jgi:hypothetical protein
MWIAKCVQWNTLLALLFTPCLLTVYCVLFGKSGQIILPLWSLNTVPSACKSQYHRPQQNNSISVRITANRNIQHAFSARNLTRKELLWISFLNWNSHGISEWRSQYYIGRTCGRDYTCWLVTSRPSVGHGWILAISSCTVACTEPTASIELTGKRGHSIRFLWMSVLLIYYY